MTDFPTPDPFPKTSGYRVSWCDRLAELEAEVERLNGTLAAVRECIVAVQNSPGLGQTGHHARWLRQALATLDGGDR